MTSLVVRSTHPPGVVLRTAAATAIGAGVAVAVAHLVNPLLDPGWSVISQFALGAQGWVLGVAFVLLAAACCLLAVGLPRGRLRRAGRTGRVLLVVAAAGLVIAAVFAVGNPLHDVGSLLGNGGLAVGAVLVGRDLRRGLDQRERSWSAVAAHAPWVCAVLMGTLIATGTWGVGLLNRAVVLAYIVWIVLAARQAAVAAAH